MTPEEFAYKVDYEGGIFGALLSYGLDEDDLDNPEGELGQLVSEFREAFYTHLSPLATKLETLLDALLEGGQDGA